MNKIKWYTLEVKIVKIEVIDKRTNKIYFVSEDYNIKFKDRIVSLKDLQKKDIEVNKIIYQENGRIDICYKKN